MASFLDTLTRVLSDAAQGYQQWEYGIKPEIEERAYRQSERAYQTQERERQRRERGEARVLQEQERVRSAASGRLNFMRAIAKGDDQRAFRIFGDAYLRSAKEAQGIDLPVRETPETARVSRESFQVRPATDASAMESFRAGERGQAFVPRVTPTTEQVEVPTGKTRRELDIGRTSRVTLAEYDPRFADTPYADSPLPLDENTGEVDIARLRQFEQGAGIETPIARGKRERTNVFGERTDARGRLNELRAQATAAKTEEQFRAALEARNEFISNIRRYKPYLGLTEGPVDVERAVAEWRSRPEARRVELSEQREARMGKGRGKGGKGRGPKSESDTDRRRREAAQADLDSSQESKRAHLGTKPTSALLDPKAYAAWQKRLTQLDDRIRRARAKLSTMGVSSRQKPTTPKPVDEFFK